MLKLLIQSKRLNYKRVSQDHKKDSGQKAKSYGRHREPTTSRRSIGRKRADRFALLPTFKIVLKM